MEAGGGEESYDTRVSPLALYFPGNFNSFVRGIWRERRAGGGRRNGLRRRRRRRRRMEMRDQVLI